MKTRGPMLIACSLTLATLLALGPATGEAAGKKFEVQDPDGQKLVVFLLDGAKIAIEYVDDGRDFILSGKIKRGKRKYTLERDQVYAEVKPKDAGFKLRTPNGQLLWKVKLWDEKVKISDNEQGTEPFVVKKKSADRAAVSRNGTDLGRVKLYPDERLVKVKDAANNERHRGPTETLFGAYGLLLMEAIPLPERYIIMAELFALGW